MHTGEAAAASAQSVGAAAYTAGNHVVFGSGLYAPGTAAGDRLLAHELTHVLQQRKISASPATSAWSIADASDPAEAEADHVAESVVAGRGAHTTGVSRSPAGLVMRAPLAPSQAMVIQRQKAEGASPAPSQKPVDPLRAEGEAFAAVAEVETNWARISTVSRPYMALIQWIRQGDIVVGLMRSHTDSGLAAIRADDHELAAAYIVAAQADKITYDYIAWHLIAYANLISLTSWVDRLVNSFDHDNRAFTGRADAERITRQLQAAIKGLDAHSKNELSAIRELPMEVRAHTPRAVTIQVTSPAIDPKVVELFRQRTAAMRDFQVNIQRGADQVNQFVEVAFKEGLDQAAEALEEYYKYKQVIDAITGGKGEQKEEPKLKRPEEPEKGTEPEPLPHPFPVPHPEPEDPEKKCPPFVLRLPTEKAPHLDTYRSWLGVLQDDPKYDRGRPAQLDKWHQAHRIGGSHPIPAEVYERGHKLGLTGEQGEDRIRVPDWTRTKGPRVDRPKAPKVKIAVDHIIELQVTPASMRDAFDTVFNYELLTEAANVASRNRIRANINAERAKQVACDPAKKDQVLIFDRVELGGGQPAERWTSEEITSGEQLDVYSS